MRSFIIKNNQRISCASIPLLRGYASQSHTNPSAGATVAGSPAPPPDRKGLSIKDRVTSFSLKASYGNAKFYARSNVGQSASYDNLFVNETVDHVVLPILSESDRVNSKFNAGVLRECTLSLSDYINHSGKSCRLFLNGPEKSGKSTILMQLASQTLAKQHGLIYIPNTFKYTRNALTYRYSPEERLYVQAAASHDLAVQLFKHNEFLFKNMTLSKSLELGPASIRQSIDKGTPISKLIDMSANDNRLSHAVLYQLIVELLNQKETPILVAIDNVQGLFMTSQVYDIYYSQLESFALSIPRILLEILANNIPISPNVHFVVTPGHRAYGKSFAVDAFTHLDARRPTHNDHGEALEPTMLPSSVSQGGPYYPVYREILDAFEIFNIPKTLTQREAKGLVDLYSKLEVKTNPMDDHIFQQAFTQTSGNPGSFSKYLRTVYIK